ncbi:MAG: hypothetical protein ACE5EI_00380 [Thermodesulfobacteriota bacterium]
MERNGSATGLKKALLASAVFIGVTCLVYYPVASDPTGAVTGPADDANAIIWHLWWFARSMADPRYSPFFTTFVESPFGVELTQMTLANHLAALPITWLIGPVGSYNLMILLSFFLSGLAVYLLVFELTGSFAPALFAGLAYSFSPYHTVFSASGGMDAAQIQYMPFTLLFAVRFARTKRPVHMGLAFLFFALSVFSFGYYAALAAVAIAVCVLYFYGAHDSPAVEGAGNARAGSGRIFLAAAAGFSILVLLSNTAEDVSTMLKISALLAAPVAAAVYFFGGRPVAAGAAEGPGSAAFGGRQGRGAPVEGLRSIWGGLKPGHRLSMAAGAALFAGSVYLFLHPLLDIAARPISDSYIVPWYSYLFPAPDHPLLGGLVPEALTPPGDPLSGRMVHVGFTLTILALAGALIRLPSASGGRARRSRGFFAFLLAAGVLLLIPPVIRAGDFVFRAPVYYLHALLPPFVDIRRVIVLVVLASSVLAGLALWALTDGIRARSVRAAVFIAAAALLAVEFAPSVGYTDMTGVPGAYRWLADRPDEVTVIEYPLTSIYDAGRYEAFYGQTIHSKRLVNPFAAVGHDPRPVNRALGKLIDRGGAGASPFANPGLAASVLARIGVDYVVVRTDKLGVAPMIDPDLGLDEVASFPDSKVYRVSAQAATATVSFTGFSRGGYFINELQRGEDAFVNISRFVRPPALWDRAGDAARAWLAFGRSATLRITPLVDGAMTYDLRFKAKSYAAPASMTVTVDDGRSLVFPLAPEAREYRVPGLTVRAGSRGVSLRMELDGRAPLVPTGAAAPQGVGKVSVGAAIRGVTLIPGPAPARRGSGGENRGIGTKTYDGIYLSGGSVGPQGRRS